MKVNCLLISRREAFISDANTCHYSHNEVKQSCTTSVQHFGADLGQTYKRERNKSGVNKPTQISEQWKEFHRKFK